MQLQQNLFSIYRLILKTPRYIFLLALIFLLVIAAFQLFFLLQVGPQLDISQCMFDYLMEKHDRREFQIAFTNSNNTDPVPSENNQTKIDEVNLVDDQTVIDIVIGKGQKCGFEINYDYAYEKQHLPFMKLVKNEHLAFIKDQSKSYLQKHNITHDKLIIPDPALNSPTFAYFYHSDMHRNEFIVEALRDSVFSLDSKIIIHILSNNLTNIKFNLNEAYLSYFYESQSLEYQKTINFFQYLTLKLFTPLLLKIVYSIGGLILVYMLSLFVGLFVRYTLITIYTAFLLVYDRCMAESWGWVHQYLAILYNRLRQNYFSTLKFMVFYVFANLGMNGLLAFGSYCIIKKLLYPLVPVPIDLYTDFLFKCFFFVELFLYVFCRSRTSLRFFPIFSFISTFLTLTIISIQEYGNTMMLLNLNFTVQMIFFTVFLLIEQAIQFENEKGLTGEYCPSMSKPRMLFYAGYDISWEKSLPPIWTYFTNWFDYSYFNQAEKCLIEKDYQLLYGRMLGLNERQEIPEFDDHENESEHLRLNEQPSNEMGLIQNDL